ncbi:MAG: bifunctional diaminohydroxyphosphoribosylaminopyrimidine deaminase/5-amino-6-(5-phosphoribosylamino)uracil reductase RibD [Candidatus Neomarinimicrobiota bacterium]
MNQTEKWLKRTLELAEKGRGFTSPNPVVGALIVDDGIVVGEGFHVHFGAPHAEVMALAQAGEAARNAALYVNLEPCCYYGKTPPCVDAIIKAGIREVYIGTIDPNPRVSGAGVKILEDAGLKVQVGVLEDEARRVNRGFFTFMEKKRPWITLKLALTIDGFIADATGKSRWITGNEARRFVLDQRLRHDAVMVGMGTIYKDDPALLPEDRSGFIPYRVVLDEALNMPPRMQLVTDEFRHRTVIVTDCNDKTEKIRQYQAGNIKIINSPKDEFGWLALPDALGKLAEFGITSIYCEGGSQLAGSLIAQRLVDELQIFVAPKILGEGLRALSGLMKSLDQAVTVEWERVEQLGADVLLQGKLT